MERREQAGRPDAPGLAARVAAAIEASMIPFCMFLLVR